MKQHAWAVGAVLVAVVGCSPSIRQRAESAYAQQDYRNAAALYDEVVAKHPNDATAKQRRLDARRQVLRLMLTAVQKGRGTGRAFATERLGSLLAQRATWEMEKVEVDAQYAAALAIEVADAAYDIDTEVARVTRTQGALVGHHVLAGHAQLLAYPDFGDRIDVIFARVSDAGRARCRELARTVSADQPFWTWTVGRYCWHWRDNSVVAAPFPDLRTGIAIEGGVSGQTDAENDRWRVALANAFRASAWYSPLGVGTLTAKLEGSLAVAFSSREVELTKDWVEQVPYTDWVTEQESYDEPYDDTETYTEQVPSTVWENVTEPCGNTTCTRSESKTVWNTETKTRTVRKYRSATRDVQRAVTRYRDVPHTYRYKATERSGHYTSKLTLRVQPDPQLGDVIAEIQRDDKQRGHDHDVRFAPANIEPARAHLPSRDQLVAGELSRMQKRLVGLLDAKFAGLYCSARSFDRLEDAAACAYLGVERAPTPVRNRLRAVFGDEEQYLGDVLARENP